MERLQDVLEDQSGREHVLDVIVHHGPEMFELRFVEQTTNMDLGTDKMAIFLKKLNKFMYSLTEQVYVFT